MTQPTHPRWCITDQCCNGQPHAGRAATIPSRDGYGTITVQLLQVADHPVIQLAGPDGFVTLTIGMARATAFILRERCRIAGGAR